MPRTIRFHLDEHVPSAVAKSLRRIGIDVTTTADAGLLGAQDSEHIAHGLRQGRVIFTEDDDFLAIASSDAAHSGLAYCRPNTRSIGRIVQALELIWEFYEPDEMKNRIEYL